MRGEGMIAQSVTLSAKYANANVTERQPINWRFTIRDARSKLHRLYPSTSA
jgi:hypothetical protein